MIKQQTKKEINTAEEYSYFDVEKEWFLPKVYSNSTT